MQTPNAFHGAPSLHPHHPAPTPGQGWEPGLVRRAVLPRAVPTLTVYADGFSCLNAEGSGLVADFKDGLCLHAPAPVRTGRQPKLWEVSAGSCAVLSAHPDKLAQLRFRVPPSEGPPPGRYALLPIAGEPHRFSLWPI
ncbi:hypothetical protein [Hymenobacter ruber]